MKNRNKVFKKIFLSLGSLGILGSVGAALATTKIVDQSSLITKQNYSTLDESFTINKKQSQYFTSNKFKVNKNQTNFFWRDSLIIPHIKIANSKVEIISSLEDKEMFSNLNLNYQWFMFDEKTNTWINKPNLNQFKNNCCLLDLNSLKPGTYYYRVYLNSSETEYRDSIKINILPEQYLELIKNKELKIKFKDFIGKIDDSLPPIYSIYNQSGYCLLKDNKLNANRSYPSFCLDTEDLNYDNYEFYLETFNPAEKSLYIATLKLSNALIQTKKEANYNNVNSVKESVNSSVEKTFEWWKIILIILASVTGILLIVYLVRFIIKKNRQKHRDIIEFTDNG